MRLPGRGDPPLVHFALVAGITSLGLMVVFAAGMVRELNAPGYGGLSLGVDFSVFWGAARLGLAGDWAAAFDPARLAEASAVPPTAAAKMVWTYPPHFHLLVAPLGALPFTAAWALFGALSVGALALAARGPARALPGAWVLLLASPATVLCLALGQNSVLLTALLIGALEAMRAGRPVLAGILIGALTMKPQLCPLLPVALAAGGRWRVLLAAAGAVAAVIGLTALVPGIGYWRGFVDALGAASGYLADGRYPEHLMITWYRAFSAAGVPREGALLMQAGISLLAAVALAWLWHRRGSNDLKAAGLLLAVPLATPYALYYDLVIPAAGVLYMARAGQVRGFARHLALLIWAAPVIGLCLLGGPGFAFSAPLLTLAFLACLRAART